MERLTIGLTHGDLNGVGYEVILKAFDNEDLLDMCTPVIYGSPKAAIFHRNACGLQTNFNVISSATEAKEGQLNLLNCFGDEELAIDFGRSSAVAGRAAFVSLQRATADLKSRQIDALVTAPINKHSIHSAEFPFPGHTEYLEQQLGVEGSDQALMILMSEQMRVALVTTHLPISQVASHITEQAVGAKIRLLHHSLCRDFLLSAPRIAVLSLNPHNGDEGLMGEEESTAITPAIREAYAEGIHCFGPYAADGFFGSGAYTHFDAILAMYHDQGLAPFKALSMGAGVNFTAGLPFVRTSPDHGTAYDIAGKNQADPSSLRQALYAAIDITRRRAQYDAAHAHPLLKQYHEKRDAGER